MPHETDVSPQDGGAHKGTSFTAAEILKFFAMLVENKQLVWKVENMEIMRSIITNYLLNEHTVLELTDSEYKELITALLLQITNLGEGFLVDSTSIRTSSLYELINDLAKAVISLSSVPKVTVTSMLTVDDLISHLNTHFQNLLTQPLTHMTSNLPLASILQQLDELESLTLDNNPGLVCSLITSVVSVHHGNMDALIAAMRRLTIWHIWFAGDNNLSDSPMDKWIIGFYCEVLKRVSDFSLATDESSLPSSWSDFLNDQIQFVFQLIKRQKVPCSSILNTLSFLLLVGGFDVENKISVRIAENLAERLLDLIRLNKQGSLSTFASDILLKMSRIVKLVCISACKPVADRSPQQSDLDRLPTRLKELAFQIMEHYNESTPIEMFTKHLQCYEWPKLLQWGSLSGVKLRQQWNSLPTETDAVVTPQVISFGSTSWSRVSGDQQHRGLVNTGNTCYANAALQLLYHCLDFRLAMLTVESHNISLHSNESAASSMRDTAATVFTESVDSTGSSSSTHYDTVEKAKLADAAAAATTTVGIRNGPLHTQLLALFRSLQDSHLVGPPVRDPGRVLTLSKPAHFLMGEQQDAVEYLHHLLERLHDEEIEALHHYDKSSIPLPATKSMYSGNITALSNVTGAASPTTGATHAAANSFAIDSDNSDAHQRTASDNTSLVASSARATEQQSHMSLVRRLFGGTLVRHTYCIECKHLSSSRQESFQCLYLPVSIASNNGSATVDSTCVPRTPVAACSPTWRNAAPADANSHVSETVTSSSKAESSNRQYQSACSCSSSSTSSDTLDLTTLIAAHFSQIEHVSMAGQCESCGRETIRARHVRLKQLASHVLICLNLFQFCHTKHTYIKALRRITIPERLTVELCPTGPTSEQSLSTVFPSTSEGVVGSDVGTPVPTNPLVPITLEHTPPSGMEVDDDDEEDDYVSDGVNSTPIIHQKTYRLQGMILHHGMSISCGHYTCLSRVGPHWVAFDDDTAEHTTLEEQVYSTPLTTPYLLLYAQA